ncbi:MAG: hypothetical protein QNJ11_00055 [Woeseiaceae bacterium]|nr:hypothetical protein [Woeseiaceae bacterium]
MADRPPNPTGMYRYTSIARPIDPAFLTNRALLIVLPLLALLSAGLAFFRYLDGSPLSASLNGVLVAFAAWALTRELAPDHDGAAFVALAIAWVSNVAIDMHQVLLVFVALVLVRVVNRSTGLPARPFDTLGVFGFCTWASVATGQPLILLVAALAFTLDAVLEKPLRVHYLAAAACLVVFAWMQVGDYDLVAEDLGLFDGSLLGVFSLGITLVVLTSAQPVSYCDVSPDRLDRMRVNAGLIVGFLLAVQTVVTGGDSAWRETPLWVCLIVVLLDRLVGVNGYLRGRR